TDPDFYLENELFTLYNNALKRLPKEFREAYELNRIHNLTHKEIALKLNVSPQTINYRISQALKILRIELKDYLPLLLLLLRLYR
ncbi:MAG: sigma factor-like helix-turn-helix DNA-binding protein, partial [Bacteroides sp.]